MKDLTDDHPQKAGNLLEDLDEELVSNLYMLLKAFKFKWGPEKKKKKEKKRKENESQNIQTDLKFK